MSPLTAFQVNEEETGGDKDHKTQKISCWARLWFQRGKKDYYHSL